MDAADTWEPLGDKIRNPEDKHIEILSPIGRVILCVCVCFPLPVQLGARVFFVTWKVANA